MRTGVPIFLFLFASEIHAALPFNPTSFRTSMKIFRAHLIKKAGINAGLKSLELPVTATTTCLKHHNIARMDEEIRLPAQFFGCASLLA